MSGPPPLPSSGLADELIPLLRSRLGLAGAAPPPAKPPEPSAVAAAPILAFADRAHPNVSAPDAAAVARPIQAVLFSLDDEEYAARIENILEILRVAPIARVPDAPPHVRGVMNLRGRLLPVVELRTILGLSPLALDGDSRVIKATVSGRILGLLVDRVSYVISVAESALEPPPRELGNRADFLAGVAIKEEGIVLFLDLEKTLSLPGGGRS